ncbi:MAG: lamin tail domain-containing protein, partial [Thermoanaerobaculia bacterium]
GYLIFGINGDSALNGGVDVDYVYSGIAIANGGDELVLLNMFQVEIDRVEYDGGPDFPDPNGASMALIDPVLDNNVGTNWCTSSTPFGDGDLGTPGGANDCVALAPELVVNEIMQNPAAVSDASGEWFEIFNPTAAAIDIDGWTIQDNDFDSHVIDNAGPLMVPAGGYVVLGNNTDSLTNGGAPVDYSYGSNWSLSNGGDEVVLIDDLGTEIDRVEYDGGPIFPDPTGASMALIDPALDNNMGINWCTSPNPFGDGDLGTPGGANDCLVVTPELVIHEILNNPAAVGDNDGEWFEIFNPSDSDVDIDGWTIRDDGSDSHVINNGGPLLVPASGYVVLGNNADSLTNGGAPVDYSYGSGWFLSNGADEVILLDDLLFEVDRVEYDGGPIFPDPTGASMALIDAALDNNMGENWCTSTSPFGDGDLGTPGRANDCLTPFVPIVINEIHADPAADLAGDANGDGVRDFSDDEFVEIVNATGAPLDLSDWTLSDGFEVRHTFPLGTVIADQCGIVVFGGGSPTGSFGSMIVQVASTGSLGLNNSGDTITLNDGVGDVVSVTYGGEGGDNQSLTRDPDITGGFVKHSVATGSGGTLFSPGTRIDGSDFGGCFIPTLEIFEIQGSGLSSPVAGMTVTTLSNVVTALGTDGFFMHTPAPGDSDVDTSDGIFVFEGGAPTVAVGDLVDVTGVVQEFFEFTEFAFGSIVTVVGTGTLPPPVIFDETVPSPDPTAPSCAIEFECYESMLIEIAEGAVTGPNQRFNPDPIAEVHITAAPDRTFREPGIEFPGIGLYPIWDGNPEVFELDPDKLGLPNLIIPAGSGFSASGVMGFEFGGYEMWPSELTVDERFIPIPVRAREFDEFTVGSLNMFRFFDDVDDLPSVAADGRVRDDEVVETEEYLRRRDKFVRHILEVLDAPDILAVQEAEKLGILEELAAAIVDVDPSVVYTSYLIEGNDIGTIDIGFMVRDTITVDEVIQLGKDEYFTNPITLEEEILHDRPPLLLQGRHLDQTLVQVFTVHMRSLGGIEGARTQQKRYDQANSVAEKVQLIQDLDPGAPIIVTGDFNAFEFSDSYVDIVGQILGDFVPTDNLVCETNDCDDLVEPNLSNQIETLPAGDRYSFIFRGNAQTLDHALTSFGMEPFVRGLEYGRGNADAAVDLINDAETVLRSSDHDGLVLYLLADGDLDGVPDHLDVCPATEIPEGVPTVRLGTNRWALVDDDFEFDTTTPGRQALGAAERLSRPVERFTTEDTAGCSCEQIIDILHLGKGHTKFGCSTGVMRNWVKMVNPK